MGAFCSCFRAHGDTEVIPSSLTDSNTRNQNHQHANTRVLRFFHRCSLIICPMRVWMLAEEVATVDQQPEAADCSSTSLTHHSIEVASFTHSTHSLEIISQGTLDFAVPDSDSSEECPTCLECYTDENPKITTGCSHHFHLPCILEWQQRSLECPNCRKVLVINKKFDL